MSMNKRNVFAAVAFAGLVAATGSAFTATSTIDEGTKTVGATSQSISGVAVSNVSYTWDSSNDTTSGVDFTIGSVLGANDTLTVSLNGTNGSCTADVSGLVYTCTWAVPVANATDLGIVVN